MFSDPLLQDCHQNCTRCGRPTHGVLENLTVCWRPFSRKWHHLPAFWQSPRSQWSVTWLSVTRCAPRPCSVCPEPLKSPFSSGWRPVSPLCRTPSMLARTTMWPTRTPMRPWRTPSSATSLPSGCQGWGTCFNCPPSSCSFCPWPWSPLSTYW